MGKCWAGPAGLGASCWMNLGPHPNVVLPSLEGLRTLVAAEEKQYYLFLVRSEAMGLELLLRRVLTTNLIFKTDIGLFWFSVSSSVRFCNAFPQIIGEYSFPQIIGF